jgi:hypothetical protein
VGSTVPDLSQERSNTTFFFVLDTVVIEILYPKDRNRNQRIFSPPLPDEGYKGLTRFAKTAIKR